MKCYYHSDADGIESAHQVLLHWRKLNPNYEFNKYDFVRVDHRSKINIYEIYTNETVFIVDFSFKPEVLRELLKITKNVIWIDHHISAIEAYDGFEHDIWGIRKDGIAASMLAYIYFNHMVEGNDYGNPKEFNSSYIKKAQMITKYISLRDTGDYTPGDDVDLFTTAFHAIDIITPNDDILYKLHDDVYANLLLNMDGPSMFRYKNTMNARYINSRGFKCKFEGYNAYACNIGMVGSDAFDKLVNKDKYDILITFIFTGEFYNYTIYPVKEGIEAYKIAEKYGGGGHSGSAAFRSKELLLKKVG